MRRSFAQNGYDPARWRARDDASRRDELAAFVDDLERVAAVLAAAA